MSVPSSPSSAPVQGAPRTRRIAFVDSLQPGQSLAPGDPAQQPMHLFETMLWVLKGITREAWTKSSPDDADIIVVHQGGEKNRRIAWKAVGKIIVEMVPQGSDASRDANNLAFPFRAADVIALLERMSGLLEPKSTSMSRSDINPGNPWRFMEHLRAVRQRGDANLWLVARQDGVPLLWMRGDGGTYKAHAETVQALRHGELQLNTYRLTTEHAAPEQLEHRLGTELCWHAAYHASAMLAPWLSPTTRFRITQWPNLGSIRPHPSLLRIVSALAATPSSLDELISRTGAPPEVAARTLNALSATESIAATEQVTAPKARATPIATPEGGFSKFLNSMRKHLGLAS